MSSSTGLMQSALRVLLGVGGLVSIGIAAGVGSVCDCPANCSPVVCVDISSGCGHIPAPSGYGECTWSVCSGYQWNDPGSRRVIKTEAGNQFCQVTKGLLVNGQCIYDPNGEDAGGYWVPGVTEVSHEEC